MSRTVYYLAATLDGFIADDDDGIEWLMTYDRGTDVATTDEVRPAMVEFDATIGALVMGSTTYEWMARNINEWPYGDRPTYVFTSRGELDPIDGATVRFVSGDIAPLADEMLASAGDRDLWVVGGGGLAVAFANAGLLDEVIVTVVPVGLGSGRPLFGRKLERALRLTGLRPFKNGMVEMRFAVEDE